jgi:MFS family permease
MTADAPVTSWRTVWLIVGAGVVAAFQIGKVPAALPFIREDYGLGLVATGWILSIFNVIGVFSGMALGAVIDRLGHRRMIIGGLLLIGVAGILDAVATAPALLYAGRSLEGLGFTTVVVAGPGLLVGAAAPKDLRIAFGFWSSYLPAGMASMLFAAPFVMASIGWHGLWLLNAGLVFVFAAVFAFGTAGLKRTAAPAPDWSGIRLTISRPGPWLLALAFAAYTAQFLAVLGFLPIILIGEAGSSHAGAAELTALAVAVNVAGAMAGGWLLHRGWPRAGLIAATALVMAVSTLAIYAPALGAPWRFAACLAFSAIGGILPTSVLSGSAQHAPRPNLVATTNGLLMQGSNLGQTLGPPVVAAVAAASGSWAYSPVVLILLALIAVAFAGALARIENVAARAS